MDKERREQIRLDRPITLFVDESPESQKATKLLKEIGLPFEVKTGYSGHNLPIATLGSGASWFTKLDGVEWLVRGLAPEAYGAWHRKNIEAARGKRSSPKR